MNLTATEIALFEAREMHAAACDAYNRSSYAEMRLILADCEATCESVIRSAIALDRRKMATQALQVLKSAQTLTIIGWEACLTVALDHTRV